MRTILITGANRGLGLEHAKRYAEAGALVHAACRDPATAADLAALAQRLPGRVVVHGYDAADPASPAALRRSVGDGPIDLLFANAGVDGRSAASLGQIDQAGFRETLLINAMAPALLAAAFVDSVAASDRRLIAVQSSRLGSIAESSGGFLAYRASKAAANMLVKTLAAELAAQGVTVVALHPGWVRTRMGGPNGALSVEESVAGQQGVLARLGVADSGGFFNYDGATIPW